MEAVSTQSRETSQVGNDGTEPLLGGQSGGFPRSGVARPSSPSLRQSNHADSGRRKRSRSPQSARGYHAGHVHRPVAFGQFGGPGGHVDATSQGPRERSSRPELAECSTPRTNKPPERLADVQRRKRSSSPHRDQDAEAAKLVDEDERQQIGNRRREASGEVARDATSRREEPQQSRVRQERVESEVQRSGEDNPPKRRRRRRRTSRREKESTKEKAVVEEEEGEERSRSEEKRISKPSSPGRKKAKPDTSPVRQDSPASSVMMEGMDDMLNGFRKWVKENPMDGLSVAQCGVHLLLQIDESPTGLSKYFKKMLMEPSTEEADERQRSLLPLPLKKDVKEMVKNFLEKKEYRRLAGTWKDKRASGSSKVQREMRKQGLMAWHCAVTLGLNFLWSSCRSDGRVCNKNPSKAQELCQERIWQAVRHFVDDLSEVKEKLVKAPSRDQWVGKLDGVKISYQGEVVEKAMPLTLDQVISGLPPAGFGGKVALADLCEGETRRLLMNPEETLLRGDDLPEVIPKPKVLASEEESNLIAKELYDRGLVRPVARCAAVGDQKILNGAFGVAKPGKLSPKGATVLRLIMDFRAVNSVMRVIEGDVRTLVGAPSLQHVVLPEGYVLRVSAEDLVSAFYLFSLPEAWSHLMCFERTVKWRMLGVERDGETYVGASVLPMGWSSAVGLMQHAHRKLALRSPLSRWSRIAGRSRDPQGCNLPGAGA